MRDQRSMRAYTAGAAPVGTTVKVMGTRSRLCWGVSSYGLPTNAHQSART
jgi:hypothetical protein